MMAQFAYPAEKLVVRARGLPYSISQEQIAAFFSGCTLKGQVHDSVHIVFNNEGRPSGECFMEFADLDSLKNALEMNNQHLGKRYIEVFHTDLEDLQKTMAKTKRETSRTKEPVVKLRGLPFGATNESITEFFQGLNIVELNIPRKENGQCEGDGYVRFANIQHAEAALEKHMCKLDWRYIEVFKSSSSEMRGIKSGGGRGRDTPYDRPQRGHKPSHGRAGSQQHTVVMRGIPFSASEGDIIKFFAPLMPKHVEIIYEESGRPAGQAHATFHSHEEAVEAMEKDKEYMDSRYVELFLDSPKEYSGRPPTRGGRGGRGDRGGRGTRGGRGGRGAKLTGAGGHAPPPNNAIPYHNIGETPYSGTPPGTKPSRRHLMTGDIPTSVDTTPRPIQFVSSNSTPKPPTLGQQPAKQTGSLLQPDYLKPNNQQQQNTPEQEVLGFYPPGYTKDNKPAVTAVSDSIPYPNAPQYGATQDPYSATVPQFGVNQNPYSASAGYNPAAYGYADPNAYYNADPNAYYNAVAYGADPYAQAATNQIIPNQNTANQANANQSTATQANANQPTANQTNATQANANEPTATNDQTNLPVHPSRQWNTQNKW